MAAAGNRVEVDWTPLDRALDQLASGLTSGGNVIAQRQATSTASKVRAGVPRRTGRLAGTVGVTPVDGGFGVTYGGGLPYAAYIEKRSHAVARGGAGAESEYGRAAWTLAQSVASRL
jgi:hypothetical protein